MKNILRYLFFIACFTFIEKPLIAQIDKIHWYSFEDAVKLNQVKPKKVFIDIFTDWCGWCKQLDRTTFTNPVIIKLMNENFYAVKLNAERKDTVVFNGYSFVNPNPTGFRSPHQLASALLKGRMSYPSMVFMDDSMRFITTVQGYLKPTDLEPILVFFGQNKYLTIKNYDTFKLSYKKIESTDISAESKTKPFVLNKVVFDPGKIILKESAYFQLDSMVAVLKKDVTIKFEIAGYTDNTGNAAANKTLSEQRAKAVYDYFVSKGLESVRIAYTGYGSLNPIADNSTAAGQKLNRRIEIKYLNK